MGSRSMTTSILKIPMKMSILINITITFNSMMKVTTTWRTISLMRRTQGMTRKTKAHRLLEMEATITENLIKGRLNIDDEVVRVLILDLFLLRLALDLFPDLHYPSFISFTTSRGDQTAC